MFLVGTLSNVVFLVVVVVLKRVVPVGARLVASCSVSIWEGVSGCCLACGRGCLDSIAQCFDRVEMAWRMRGGNAFVDESGNTSDNGGEGDPPQQDAAAQPAPGDDEQLLDAAAANDTAPLVDNAAAVNNQGAAQGMSLSFLKLVYR
jgi:hypothetical protein